MGRLYGTNGTVISQLSVHLSDLTVKRSCSSLFCFVYFIFIESRYLRVCDLLFRLFLFCHFAPISSFMIQLIYRHQTYSHTIIMQSLFSFCLFNSPDSAVGRSGYRYSNCDEDFGSASPTAASSPFPSARGAYFCHLLSEE